MRPAFVSIKPGLTVRFEDRLYEVERIVGPNRVHARDLTSGEERPLPTAQVVPYDAKATEEDKDADTTGEADIELETIPQEDWQVAEKRLEAIQPLLALTRRTKEDVEAAAGAADVHYTTIYAWLRAYQDSGHLSSLVPRHGGTQPGSVKLDRATDDIIQLAIEEVYLTKKQKRPSDVIEEVFARCRAAGVKPPHPNTVRKRIKRLPAAVCAHRRQGRAAARDNFDPILGPFPDADFPMSVVQIDHTEADVVLVEEETRLAMGRPWMTVAIDIFTRMIVGLYISMDRPSGVAAGLCIARSMLEKTTYLEALGVPGDWPAFGHIRSVHMDNAKEFRGKTIARACAQHGIETDFRPVQVPHYGGHIERYMGVLAGEFRKLDGSTAASSKHKGAYDPVRNATMTMAEFEAYVVDFIVNVYHRQVHSALGIPPLTKWQRAAMMTDEDGLPCAPIRVVADPERVTRDFLPFEERTVQRYGLALHGIEYFDEVLTPWIGAQDPSNARAKRKFVIRYDPRDMSAVYFYDPEASRYYTIPYRNLRHPAVSLWEIRAAQRALKEEGRRHVNEDAIFEAIERNRGRREDAKHKTLAARRGVHKARTSRTVRKRGPVATPSVVPTANERHRPDLPSALVPTSEVALAGYEALGDPDEIEAYEDEL